MKIESYLIEVDRALSEKWEEDRKKYIFTEKDSNIATVLTRIDSGLNVATNTYNSKLLKSINVAVWEGVQNSVST